MHKGMVMPEDINIRLLKESASDVHLLYVEDNPGLREKVSALLGKFFAEVVNAPDGEEGLALFRQVRPKVVLTDIKMPKMNGLEMAQHIHNIDPSVKVVIASAFDDKPYLFEALRIGVFDYIKKPFSVDDMVEVMVRAVAALEQEESRDIFTVYMHDILNYQSNLLLLMHQEKPIFSNQTFLDFFEVDRLEDYLETYGDLGKSMEEHKGFLYNQEGMGWYENASLYPDKLFHVKIKDPKLESHHFILKFHPIPDKPGHSILSLDDVTELNLLSLFDERATQRDQDLKDMVKLFNLFDVVRQNSAKVKILNFYKGLTIANDGIVVAVDEHSVTLKTNFMQQKAVQMQKQMVISSEAFPMDVHCGTIASVDFEAQTIVFSEAKFTERSPSARKNVRVVPEEGHTVSLFYMERKFFGETRIVDLSISSVKLELDALPAGLQSDEPIVVDMVLSTGKTPMIINTKAKVFRVEQSRYHYHVVCFMELGTDTLKQLTGYIAKRQMDLIREFKGMQIGK